MSRIAKSIGLSAVALLLTTHRLPAPISEEKPSPTPEMEKSKTGANRKSIESSDSNSAQRFNGTWKGTLVDKQLTGYVHTYNATLIIREGKTADATAEVTSTLPRGGSWNNLPDAYRHLSPLYHKVTNHSDHLVAGGSDLMIRWSGLRLIDWSPKTLPLAEAEKMAGLDKNYPVAFTLKGDELVFGKFVYHRVK